MKLPSPPSPRNHPYFKAPGPYSKLQAFTLTEILIAISIVGVLAALVLPSVNSIIGKSKEAACLSQTRQLGLAFLSYASDNDGYGPYDARDNGNSNTGLWRYGGQNIMFGQLFPYLGIPEDVSITPKILVCPETPKQFLASLSKPVGTSGGSRYWMNNNVSTNANNRVKLLKMSQNTAAIVDACTWWSPVSSDNHQGRGLSVFYLNGSVAWIPTSKTKGASGWSWSVLANN